MIDKDKVPSGAVFRWHQDILLKFSIISDAISDDRLIGRRKTGDTPKVGGVRRKGEALSECYCSFRTKAKFGSVSVRTLLDGRQVLVLTRGVAGRDALTVDQEEALAGRVPYVEVYPLGRWKEILPMWEEFVTSELG